jgi:hypothetical protein
MENLKVQTNEVLATIRFDKDTRIDGTIFLGKAQWDKPLASKVSAYLEDEKEFLPFQVLGAEHAELINKKTIKTVEWEDNSIDRENFPDTSHKQEVTLTFIDDETITGTLVSDTPPEHSRLSDCLNTNATFIHLVDDKHHIHVNKSVLLRVTGA